MEQRLQAGSLGTATLLRRYTYIKDIPWLMAMHHVQVEEKPLAQLQSQLLWKLRQYMEQLLQAGSLGTVMAAVLQDLKAGLHIS